MAVWDFQDDQEGGKTVTAVHGAELLTLTARGTKTVVKDAADRGPFGPSLVLDGETVFVKDGDIGALDVTKSGNQVSVVNWVKDTADNHDDNFNGTACRAGSHCEGGPDSARQYASYFDAIRYIGWSHGHYTPHIGAQDGPSPGYPYNRDYAASARKYFTGVGQGQWHMEAFTYDGETITAYVDGLSDVWKAVAEPAPDEPGYSLHQTVDRNPFFLGKPINNSPTTKRFSIGAAVSGEPPDFHGVNFTDGKLGGVAVFNRALTADEIMAIRLGTLRPGEPITMFSFEVTSPGPHPLREIGWTAVAGTLSADVSAGIEDDYRASRPADSDKAFLRKANPAIGATWIPLTGLSASQVKRLRFKLLSALPSSAQQRVLIRTGEKWWASNSAYGTKTPHANASNWSEAETVVHVMSWGPGQWRPVTLEPDALALADGANTEPISADRVTAIGFISAGGDGSAARVTDLELLAD
ncbi:LamG domain-containing protein [Mycobacterium sp. DL592]|uniref:LamG domain-containing protein n=1 Tax=Mycobacterium sp. DL592 TaxID=2675524 RepID=UPI0014209F73|nr:LamG domain-containing protein [Mycobacterium sp. DL592]